MSAKIKKRRFKKNEDIYHKKLKKKKEYLEQLVSKNKELARKIKRLRKR